MRPGTTIVRRPDWRPRLTAYLGQVRRTPFGYARGQLDCAGFAAGAVRAMTGRDLARGWRGYRSAAEGRRLLRDRGFDGPVALIASLLAEVPPLLARPGDVVVLAGDAVGICQGRLAYAMRGAGVVTVDMAEARRAFRVPLPEDPEPAAPDPGEAAGG